MIVSRLAAVMNPITQALTYLPTRAVGAVLSTECGQLRVVGVYVPSRDASAEKTERKRRWLSEFAAALTANGTGGHTLEGYSKPD